MTSKAFFDTNVLVYAQGSDPVKAARSDELLGGGGWVSVQVLNEFASVARSKLRLDWAYVAEMVEAVMPLVAVQDLTLAVHRAGIVLARRHQLSIWDGLIVAAALEAGCDVLWSEDMHDGLVIDGRLRVANPYVPS